MQEILGYGSAILITLSAIPYIRDILLLKTKPQRASWLIWSILLLIAFFAQLSEGGTWSLLTTGTDCLAVLIIFGLSIKYGMGGTTKFDVWALVGAGIGLVLWYITNNALVALLITIFIDFCGGILTIVKTYKEPHTETLIAYLMTGTGALLGTISVGKLDFTLLIFPAWIAILNYSIAGTIVLGKRKLRVMAK